MSTEAVFDSVGGYLDREHDNENEDYEDSCALRLSIGLNGCGEPFKIPPGAPGAGRVPNGKIGTDRVIISARKMCEHLEKEWGAPDYEVDPYVNYG